MLDRWLYGGPLRPWERRTVLVVGLAYLGLAAGNLINMLI